MGWLVNWWGAMVVVCVMVVACKEGEGEGRQGFSSRGHEATDLPTLAVGGEDYLASSKGGTSAIGASSTPRPGPEDVEGGSPDIHVDMEVKQPALVDGETDILLDHEPSQEEGGSDIAVDHVSDGLVDHSTVLSEGGSEGTLSPIESGNEVVPDVAVDVVEGVVDDKGQEEAEVEQINSELVGEMEESGGKATVQGGGEGEKESGGQATVQGGGEGEKEEVEGREEVVKQAGERVGGVEDVDEANVEEKVETEMEKDEGEEDVPTFEEFKQKKLQEQENVPKSPQESMLMANIPVSKTKNNYASVDCGAKVIATNPEAQNPTAVLQENKDIYMLNPCSAKIWFVVELCELVSVRTLEIGCFELFSSIPESFVVYSSESYPTQDWDKWGTLHAANQRTLQSFPLATDGNVYAKYIKVEMLSYYGNEHFCPLSLLRVLGASMIEVYEYAEEQKEQQHSQSVVLPPSEGGDGELLDQGSNGTILSAAKDAVLSLLDKPLSLLGKVNGILKPEDKKGRGEDEAFASSDKGETEGGVEVAMERAEIDSLSDTNEEGSSEQEELGAVLETEKIVATPPPVAFQSPPGEDGGEVLLQENGDSLRKGVAAEGENSTDIPAVLASGPELPPQEVLTGNEEVVEGQDKSAEFEKDIEIPQEETQDQAVIDRNSKGAGNASAQDRLQTERDSETADNHTSESLEPPPAPADSMWEGEEMKVKIQEEVEEAKDLEPNRQVQTPLGPVENTGDVKEGDGQSGHSTLGPTDTAPLEGHFKDDRDVLESKGQIVTEETTDSTSLHNSNQQIDIDPPVDDAVETDSNSAAPIDEVVTKGEGTGNDYVFDVAGSEVQDEGAQPPDGELTPPGAQPREKSVFVRLSNRITNVEENMSLFGSYLDQISTSLKKNKNKTEDAHRSLDKRVSALTDSLEALRKEVLHSADGLEKLYGEVQEVASAVSNMSTGLQAISLELSGWLYWILATQLVAIFLLFLLVSLCMSYMQRAVAMQIRQLVATSQYPSLNHVAPFKEIKAPQPIRMELPCRELLVSNAQPERLRSVSDPEGYYCESWQVVNGRKKKRKPFCRPNS